MVPETPGPDAIRVEGLRFAWPDHPPVLDIERFNVARGEKLFLRGPNAELQARDVANFEGWGRW